MIDCKTTVTVNEIPLDPISIRAAAQILGLSESHLRRYLDGALRPRLYESPNARPGRRPWLHRVYSLARVLAYRDERAERAARADRVAVSRRPQPRPGEIDVTTACRLIGITRQAIALRDADLGPRKVPRGLNHVTRFYRVNIVEEFAASRASAVAAVENHRRGARAR